MQESNATNNQTVRALTTRIRVTQDRFIDYRNLIEEKLNKDEECEELRKKNEELTKELSDLRAEIVKLFETISEQASGQVEKEDKEMEEELFENVSEQAQDNAEGAKQQDQLDQAEIIEPFLEKDDKKVVNEPLDTVLEDKNQLDLGFDFDDSYDD